jgi:3-oxoacyl-[acyl-carrier protein] reductase
VNELGSARCIPLPVNVCDPEATNIIRAAVSKHHDGIDALVHNAGITRDKTLGKMTSDQWSAVVDTNLRSILAINRAMGLAEHTSASDTCFLRPGARVVLMSSVNGIAGAFGQTNYAYAKAALIGYAAHLGSSASLRKRGICVNAIAPGFIETKMTAAMPWLARETGRRTSCFSQGGLPWDIAAATAFLVSPSASSVTGQTLRVCGGNLVGK